MIRLLESFDPYATAQLPASNKWTTAVGVTIQADAGRSGFTGDNAAAFDASLGSLLSRTIALTAVAGIVTATLGQAIQPLTVGSSGVTLASILTPVSSFDLVLTSLGTLKITQTSGGILLGTICETRRVLTIGVGGYYVEAQLQFVLGVSNVVLIRIADQYGDMNTVASGDLFALLAGEVPTTVRLGGGVGETGTWLVDDVYLTDGVPAATGQLTRQGILYNDSFLGNTHIQTFYPTADGTNLDVDNTPWAPNLGTVQYVLINEHPPDEDIRYISADTGEQTSTFAYQAQQVRPFGLLNCAAFAPIYGLQWDGRMRAEAVGSVAPIVRKIVTGTIPGDAIAEGTAQPIISAAYLYYPVGFDRNPIDGLPWDFSVFYPSAVGGVGTTEIGARLL